MHPKDLQESMKQRWFDIGLGPRWSKLVVRFEDLVMTVIPQPLAQAKLKWCNEHLEP